MGEAFREMISEKTYSALESRAQRGQSAGGVSYGYRDCEAEIVRRIFELYADGVSPRGIVDRLNREAVHHRARSGIARAAGMTASGWRARSMATQSAAPAS